MVSTGVSRPGQLRRRGLHWSKARVALDSLLQAGASVHVLPDNVANLHLGVADNAQGCSGEPFVGGPRSPGALRRLLFWRSSCRDAPRAAARSFMNCSQTPKNSWGAFFRAQASMWNQVESSLYSWVKRAPDACKPSSSAPHMARISLCCAKTASSKTSSPRACCKSASPPSMNFRSSLSMLPMSMRAALRTSVASPPGDSTASSSPGNSCSI
mmetsp:Transcript_78767/g.218944  ORF Transcript_78767/g.218944 Transcript_78767/m.218944 type:complete len:213 (-) Transcript_78767:1657-2295(-)